ncbi:PREDICTED: uncharacterized protein LOC103319837 isoform X2 [Prunus mume]|uniref:Uncharacterized protein LOC103319837 isoform X2 n=1 Tax=Prunus mume TaxID=102107 RepID=A0ABM0N531_PRUMU|nr:PREDICTED: uncharacterized protein LOC103319837 isoform X2 [Prunus mume]
MEFVNKAVSAATRAAKNNTVINVCLVGSFIALSVRSVKQQNDIKSLEAEKASLIKSNKAAKQTVWDWKQQLYAEASSTDAAVLVPLARLKAIYGEAPVAQIEAVKEESKSAASKFVV